MNLLSNSEKLISNAKTFLWHTSRLIPMLEQNCNGFGHPKVPDFTKKCKPHQFYYYGIGVKIQSAIASWPFEILIWIFLWYLWVPIDGTKTSCSPIGGIFIFKTTLLYIQDRWVCCAKKEVPSSLLFRVMRLAWVLFYCGNYACVFQQKCRIQYYTTCFLKIISNPTSKNRILWRHFNFSVFMNEVVLSNQVIFPVKILYPIIQSVVHVRTLYTRLNALRPRFSWPPFKQN